MMSYPAAALIAVLSIVGAAGFGYWKGGEHMKDSIKADERIAQIAYEASLRGTAEIVGKIKIQNKYITQPLQKEVIHDPVFSNPACFISDTTFGLLNYKLVHGGQAERDGLGGVPAGVPAADGQVGGLPGAETR